MSTPSLSLLHSLSPSLSPLHSLRHGFSVKCARPTRLATAGDSARRCASCCTETSPSRTCFAASCCADLPPLIKSFQERQALCPSFFSFLSFFFFCKYHRDSLISSRPQLSSPRILDSKSNPANAVLSCLLIGSALWTRESLASG